MFLVLTHERRRILHFAVIAYPTAEWTAHQLRQAFPWDTAPRYLLRDHDRIFGRCFVEQVRGMGIRQVLSAPRSRSQRAYVERVIGTIRREYFTNGLSSNGEGKTKMPSTTDVRNRRDGLCFGAGFLTLRVSVHHNRKTCTKLAASERDEFR